VLLDQWREELLLDAILPTSARALGGGEDARLTGKLA